MPYGIPDDIIQQLSVDLNCIVKDFKPVGGGCINSGGQLITDTGVFFLKWNSASKFPGMFVAEARGLDLLRHADAIHIPAVVIHGASADHQYLVLEFVRQTSRAGNYSESLGAGLAALHRRHHDRFGLDHSNYVGSLEQSNQFDKNWSTFFIQQRLLPLTEMAIRNGEAPASWLMLIESLSARLSDIIPDEPPSLLHGDLWSGNVIVNSDGLPCLIDPAVYYGHREMDLAMTKLFGGFDDDFYDSYNDHFALAPGYKARTEVFNLYPLLVHVNLFGGGYASGVQSVLSRFA